VREKEDEDAWKFTYMKVSGEGGRRGRKQRSNCRGSSMLHGHGDDGKVIQQKEVKV